MAYESRIIASSEDIVLLVLCDHCGGEFRARLRFDDVIPGKCPHCRGQLSGLEDCFVLFDYRDILRQTFLTENLYLVFQVVDRNSASNG